MPCKGLQDVSGGTLGMEVVREDRVVSPRKLWRVSFKGLRKEGSGVPQQIRAAVN